MARGVNWPPSQTDRSQLIGRQAVVIARIWKGDVPLERSEEYLTRMRAVAIPDYRSTEGNQGAYALRREHQDHAEFLMLTFWDSQESIKAFAGDDINSAKYYDFDAEVLLEMNPQVDHFEMYDD
jgi:heme-degrading monooxygenase HmoA